MVKPLWTPTQGRIADAEITKFRQAVERHTGRPLPDYTALHAWSVENPREFWSFFADYTSIKFATKAHTIMSDEPMPDTKWFEGATLNYAEALLYSSRLPDENRTAIIALDEAGRERHLTYAQLRLEVARCAEALKRSGVKPGDRVAASIANVPEAVILLLAAASMGAIYSACSPDFGYEAALARFGQIEPKVFVASDGYDYNGKHFSTVETIRRLRSSLKGLEQVVLISHSGERSPDGTDWSEWLGLGAPALFFEPLPFDYPLYILYSSGTTGLPKAMVHRAGGVLITHYKEHQLHCDVKPGDVVFYFTTCGWMMWNWLVSVLAQGAAIVLYEGSPSYPDLGVLWRLAERLEMTLFGTSARFIHSCKAAGLKPNESVSLPALKTLTSTGSPLSPAGFEWVYEAVKEDVHLASIAGGTDIVSCFMGGNPAEAVYAGQLQRPGLGVDLVVYNEAGEAVVGEPGELICRKPLPSMPLMFWNDPDYERYREAYFDVYPGVWRHGDLIELTEQGGVIVYGRSDATLNPGGVRIGTAEIYRPLEAIPDVVEAAAVGKKEAADEAIWLFVVLQPGVTLSDALASKIKQQIRKGASPRHVPKRIVQVSQLPRTRSGKLVEIAVARLVNGQHVPNREVMANPEALDEIARALQ